MKTVVPASGLSATLTMEEVLPIVRDLARKKARVVTGRFAFAAADRPDVESQLVLKVLNASYRFDSGRASFATFASRLMDNEVRSILRYRNAVRRHRIEVSYEEEHQPNEEKPSGQLSHHRRILRRNEFWLDVERALAPLPSALRETAEALCWNSPSEVSRSSGRSRTTIYARIRHLRNAFTAAGIGPTYFASSGVDR